ncbi:MAG: hypothetical protein QOI64_28, partial [Solirubrobacteraceae bacterium]|nr:hypothetical protein [Solirubrobacteraceae bacterium]
MTVSTTVAPGLASQIRALLDQAGPAAVPSGVLAWWGRTDFPDGTGAVPTLTQQAWEGTYFLLENAALQPGTVAPLPALEAATRDMRPDGPLPIAIAHFRIAVPKADLA